METFARDVDQLARNTRLSGEELNEMGVKPTEIDCFSYSHYVLYQKGNKRLILQPLPGNMFKLIRTYDFVDYN